MSPSRLRNLFSSSTWVRAVDVLEENGIITMALLSKEQIWSAQDILWEDIPVPEWGGEVRVKGLTGRERDKFEADSLAKAKKGGQREVILENMRARLVVMCATDENFQPLFERRDVMRLGEKSAVALERVFAAAQRLSGMTDEDMEEMAGNSESDQNGSSTSD
jgi:hypothetical protein